MLRLTKQDLLKVNRPARYVGGEFNQIIKDKKDIKCRTILCFPDIYDIGMSNLNMKITYDILNKRQDTWCERTFAPWSDLEEIMRKKNIELYALESKDSIRRFDIIDFEIQNELNYTNILNMLSLGNIDILSSKRKECDPLVIAEGSCTSNPYPMSKFIDLFIIDENKYLINEVVEKYINAKNHSKTKLEFLYSLKDIEGIFIPLIHTKKDRIVQNNKVKNSKVIYPEKEVVSSIKIKQDYILLEIKQDYNISEVIVYTKKLISNTGKKKIKIYFLGMDVESKKIELLEELFLICEKNNISLILPIIDSCNFYLLKKIKLFKKSPLVFSLNAGSERLRKIIDNKINEEDILNGCKIAFENGFNNIYLNFTIGLPTETFQDIEDIVLLSNSIVKLFYNIPKEKRKSICNITVETFQFMPKPHTYFQWCSQNSIDKINMKQQYLKDKLIDENIKYKWHNPAKNIIESFIARGDETTSDVIYEAFKNGAKLDNFEEQFNLEYYTSAFKKLNMDEKIELYKKYDLDYKFSWDNIFYGADKYFLKNKYIELLEISKK